MHKAYTRMQRTYSELVFERWLDNNGLSWRPIPTEQVRTPDYAVILGPSAEIVFELKQIESDRNWEDDIVHGGEIGAFVRERINRSKPQIRTSSSQGKPTVLVVFNAYDPLQLSGTEDHDFIFAMYGAYTLKMSVESGKIIEGFHGRGKSFQANKNTSFSAIARLKEGGREAAIRMTIFENIHARVPIDYDSLPPCFEVVRFNLL
ncbi:hypothetical protein [Xanthobacter autotrophicus]|uniref:hypothetical protein n=1 Tax=Xanthobacter autotrophicus TaxID=280 RepID=UPI00372909FD